MHENQQPQTEAVELSAAEREAIEHEMHHYEDPRAYAELCAPAADPVGDPRQPGIRPDRLSG